VARSEGLHRAGRPAETGPGGGRAAARFAERLRPRWQAYLARCRRRRCVPPARGLVPLPVGPNSMAHPGAAGPTAPSPSSTRSFVLRMAVDFNATEPVAGGVTRLVRWYSRGRPASLDSITAPPASPLFLPGPDVHVVPRKHVMVSPRRPTGADGALPAFGRANGPRPAIFLARARRALALTYGRRLWSQQARESSSSGASSPVRALARRFFQPSLRGLLHAALLRLPLAEAWAARPAGRNAEDRFALWADVRLLGLRCPDPPENRLPWPPTNPRSRRAPEAGQEDPALVRPDVFAKIFFRQPPR